MKIITPCAKIIKVFSTTIIIICAYELLILVANFNPSEMSKTFIFVKKCVSLCSIYYDR